jgi:multisubunit Na+/H+ antiporter MnhE subunit
VRVAGRIAALTLLWLGLWLLLEQKWAADELLIGAACALVAALATEAAWGVHLTSFAARPRLLLQAWRLPWIYLSGTVEIFTVLALHLFTRRKAASLLREVRFDAAPDDPQASARRALAIGYTTMTPNFVIIGIDQERCTMLYHQLRATEVPEMTRRLGACP